MRAAIIRATRKIRRSAQLLDYRRINWRVATNHMIRCEFEAFVRAARDQDFPFELHVQQHETPNEEVIQVAPARSHTGIVDRKQHAFWANPSHTDTPVFEFGGELVASQSATGYVHFIVSPRRSDRLVPTRKELILLRPYDPAEISPRLVRKVLKRYLLVLQDTSIIGTEDALTFFERITVIWMHISELRARHAFYRSLLALRNEWGKALVAGAVAFAVGYVTGSGRT
jgi:hypothetical protein